MKPLTLILALIVLAARGMVAEELDLAKMAMGTVEVFPLEGDDINDLTLGNSSGSGTVIDNKVGLVVTNHHVVANEDEGTVFRYACISVAVNLEQAPVPSYIFEVVQSSEEKDIALLRYVKTLPDAPVRLSDLPVYDLSLKDRYATVDSLKLNGPIVAIGYPGYNQTQENITLTVTNGKISGFLADTTVPEVSKAWIKTDALVSWGNSGGTVVDAQGRFIGIPTQVMLDKSGGRLGKIRPVDLVLPFYERALKIPVTGSGSPDKGAGVRVWNFGFTLNPSAKDASATTAFETSASALYAGFDYSGIKKKEAAREAWTLNGSLIAESSGRWTGTEAGHEISKVETGGVPLPEGVYEFVFSLGDNTLLRSQCTVGRAPGSDQVVDLTGSCLDSVSQKPVAAAKILVLKEGVTIDQFRKKMDSSTVLAIAKSDRAGVWKVSRVLERGKVYSLVIAADGYETVMQDKALILPTGKKSMDLTVSLKKL